MLETEAHLYTNYCLLSQSKSYLFAALKFKCNHCKEINKKLTKV